MRSWFLRAAQASLTEGFIELVCLYDDRNSEAYNLAEASRGPNARPPADSLLADSNCSPSAGGASQTSFAASKIPPW
jgi:hypothetical protein